MSVTGVDKDVRFALIPEWVLFHDELSPQAVRLYCVLDRHADRDTRDCIPSRARLAGLLGVSVKTVDRALAELVAVRAVTVEHRVDAAGDATSNRYLVHVVPPRPTAAAAPLGGGDMDDATPGHQCPQGGDTDDATGGVTDDALTRTTSNDYPPTPASGGAGCARHTTPARNCRGCGTTNRQLQAQAKADADRRYREAQAAAAAAERARPRGRAPGTENARALARAGTAAARAATTAAQSQEASR